MNEPRDDELVYFIEHARLRIGRQPLDGLSVWSSRFTEYRRQGRYDLCRRLLHAIKGVDLPTYGKGVVRYGEGWLYDRIGMWREAIRAYQSSLDAFATAGIPIQAEIWGNIGSLYQDQGLWSDAESAYQQALATATDDRARGLILNNLGGLHVLRSDAVTAIDTFTRARVLLTAADDSYNAAAAQVGLATALCDQSRFGDAQQELLAALQTYRQLEDHHALGTAIGALARAYHLAGHIAAAQTTYEVALTIFISVDDRIGIAKTLANLGLVQQQSGDLDAARERMLDALDEYRALGDHHGQAVLLINMARLHQQLNEPDQAQQAAATAQDLCQRHGYHDELQRLHAVLNLPNGADQPPRRNPGSPAELTHEP
jgi:tetratricopeptide (TPR) repeat protein